jgi:hypothetical protein
VIHPAWRGPHQEPWPRPDIPDGDRLRTGGLDRGSHGGRSAGVKEVLSSSAGEPLLDDLASLNTEVLAVADPKARMLEMATMMLQGKRRKRMCCGKARAFGREGEELQEDGAYLSARDVATDVGRSLKPIHARKAFPIL